MKTQENPEQGTLFAPPPRKIGGKSEYARHRGCVPSAVTKALREGRISAVLINGREMIDFAAADAAWATSTRARIDAHPPPPRGPTPAADPEQTAARDDLRAARLRRERAAASLVEHRLGVERGTLIERAAVQRDMTKAVGVLLGILDALPDRLAQRLSLVRTPNADTIRAAVIDELDEYQHAVADELLRVAGRSTAPPAAPDILDPTRIPEEYAHDPRTA